MIYLSERVKVCYENFITASSDKLQFAQLIFKHLSNISFAIKLQINLVVFCKFFTI